MTTKVMMTIEQYDNGIAVNWLDPSGACDSEKRVALKGNEAREIGAMIWDDVRFSMDAAVSNKVTLTIEYQSEEDE